LSLRPHRLAFEIARTNRNYVEVTYELDAKRFDDVQRIVRRRPRCGVTCWSLSTGRSLIAANVSEGPFAAKGAKLFAPIFCTR
jgi:hypothetical protein